MISPGWLIVTLINDLFGCKPSRNSKDCLHSRKLVGSECLRIVIIASQAGAF